MPLGYPHLTLLPMPSSLSPAQSPASSQAGKRFTITDLAREFGVTPRTIRYYEDQGLLFPEREGRNRVYGKRDRTRLKLALRGKRLGLSLAEIRHLINMYDPAAQNNRAQLERLLAVLAVRKGALLQQREDIDAVLQEINQFDRQCRDLLGH